MKEDAAFPDLFVIPTDFSNASLNACCFALELATKFKARIKLMHSYNTPELTSVTMDSSEMLISSTLNEIRETAEKNLAIFLDKIRKYAAKKNLEDIPVTTHLINGIPEEITLYTSEAEKAGLIIMGVSGTETRSFEPMGKTASRIVDKSVVPVLIIPEEMELKGIDQMKNILYPTAFDESDFSAIGKLMAIVKNFSLNVFCLHIGENESSWDKVKMEGLKTYFTNVYGLTGVKSDLVFSKDIIKSLDDYIASNGIHIMTITKRKRNILSKLINPSLTLKILYHTRIPLLVFRA